MKLFPRAAAVAALLALAACQQPAAPNAAAPSAENPAAPAVSASPASAPAQVSAQDASLPQPCQEYLAVAEACANRLSAGSPAVSQQVHQGVETMRETFRQIPPERQAQVAEQCTALLTDFRQRAASQGC